MFVTGKPFQLSIMDQSILLGRFVSQKEMESCEYDTRGGIHNTTFSSKLTNGPNTLECYITVGCKWLLGTNTLA
jgi:hypothetical protein